MTICTYNRECLFGEVVDGEMYLNNFGKIVEKEWWKSSEIRKEIELDAFRVMPNHIHGIVMIKEIGQNHFQPVVGAPVGAQGLAPLPLRNNEIRRLYRKPKSLSSFIAGYKSVCKTKINNLRNTPGATVWQRNFTP